MSFDLSKAAQFTIEVVKSPAGVTDGMGQLLDYCSTHSPNPVWDSIRKLDFEKDKVELRIWLEKVLSQEPPSPEINAFWFGLFNPILPNKQPTCGLYISGSTHYKPGEDSIDWATWGDDSYLPKGRYANSSVLHKIYELVNANDVGDFGEYIFCLGYAGLAIKTICGEVSPKLLFGQHVSRAIAVGFDSGDFILIRTTDK